MHALNQQIEEVANKRTRFAVALLDLDRFKTINDTYGHASGDRLLETVAERLRAGAPAVAMVARLGGDEFGLLLPDVASPSVAKSFASQVLESVNRVVTIEDREFVVSACCGLTFSRRGEENTVSRLLADADLALYEAKAASTGGVAVFARRMEQPHRRRTQLERALRLPDVQEKIHLVFQPIIDLKTGQVSAFEALARWNDAELGAIPPSEFVPIAEQLNVIGRISNHLMVQAFREAARWPSPISLSFNLSAVQLMEPGLAQSVLAQLSAQQLAPDRLHVEVTETALMVDFERARQNLECLRKAGVSIVLDDFGAGFASISYLREIRFDQIKLDGSLIASADESLDGQRLLAAVIGLCEALGVATVAEHIETEQQLRLVLGYGCCVGQGYWLHAPMTADSANALANATSLMTDYSKRSSRHSSPRIRAA